MDRVSRCHLSSKPVAYERWPGAAQFFTRPTPKTERKNDKIEKLDIANLLCRCMVTLVEINKESGEEEWRAEGTDGDGRKISAVVVVYEDVGEIKVVTTWANKK